jgi:TRAP transporter 4TM/12TM fusion protein
MAIDLENMEVISDEVQEKVREKYDTDTLKRTTVGIMGMIITGVALLMALFHVYTSGFGLLETMRQRGVHLMFILMLSFLLYPATSRSRRDGITIFDGLFTLASIVAAGYVVVEYQAILFRGGMPNELDIVMGILTAVLVIEGTRRTCGYGIPIISIIFLAYAVLGPYMPGVFAHKGASLTRLIDHLYMIPEGIFSIALGTSATYIALFIILAAFLERSGLGELIMDLALTVAGRSYGGPAKVSVFSSALFGTISGSAASNVVIDGVFTIPMMVRAGYKKEYAAAVEAVTSTGGQLMPPIMGSSAFIMADWLGIPYSKVALAAVVPALLYYTGLWIFIHINAVKTGIMPTSKDKLPKLKNCLKERGHLLIPVFAIIALLYLDFTALYAGFWGIIITVASAALRKSTRMGVKDVLWSLEIGAKRTVAVAMACACVGFIIGVCTLTGIAVTLGNYILDISQGSLLLTLLMVMLLSILMGMGMPTVAVYVILATVAAPVLVKFGIPALAAHMFVFYFGMIANITPPVAIPAYAAAGLAGADPSKTGWTAVRIGLPIFLIPFIFVYSPSILIVNFNWFDFVTTTVSSLIGVSMLAMAIENFMMGPLAKWQRAATLIGGLLMIHVGVLTDVIGAVILLGIIGTQWSKKKKGA